MRWKEWKHAWSAYKAFPIDILLPSLHITRKSKDLYVIEDTRGLPGKPVRLEIDHKTACLLLATHPVKDIAETDLHRVVEAGFAFAADSWLIPLPTAEPGLIKEFEHETLLSFHGGKYDEI
jgi:hypothetical protein